MKKGKCSVCGQDMFDPLLGEVKEANGTKNREETVAPFLLDFR